MAGLEGVSLPGAASDPARWQDEADADVLRDRYNFFDEIVQAGQQFAEHVGEGSAQAFTDVRRVGFLLAYTASPEAQAHLTERLALHPTPGDEVARRLDQFASSSLGTVGYIGAHAAGANEKTKLAMLEAGTVVSNLLPAAAAAGFYARGGRSEPTQLSNGRPATAQAARNEGFVNAELVEPLGGKRTPFAVTAKALPASMQQLAANSNAITLAPNAQAWTSSVGESHATSPQSRTDLKFFDPNNDPAIWSKPGHDDVFAFNGVQARNEKMCAVTDESNRAPMAQGEPSTALAKAEPVALLRTDETKIPTLLREMPLTEGGNVKPLYDFSLWYESMTPIGQMMKRADAVRESKIAAAFFGTIVAGSGWAASVFASSGWVVATSTVAGLGAGTVVNAAIKAVRAREAADYLMSPVNRAAFSEGYVKTVLAIKHPHTKLEPSIEEMRQAFADAQGRFKLAAGEDIGKWKSYKSRDALIAYSNDLGRVISHYNRVVDQVMHGQPAVGTRTSRPELPAASTPQTTPQREQTAQPSTALVVVPPVLQPVLPATTPPANSLRVADSNSNSDVQKRYEALKKSIHWAVTASVAVPKARPALQSLAADAKRIVDAHAEAADEVQTQIDAAQALVRTANARYQRLAEGTIGPGIAIVDDAIEIEQEKLGQRLRLKSDAEIREDLNDWDAAAYLAEVGAEGLLEIEQLRLSDAHREWANAHDNMRALTESTISQLQERIAHTKTQIEELKLRPFEMPVAILALLGLP